MIAVVVPDLALPSPLPWSPTPPCGALPQSVVLYALPELDGAIDTVTLGGLVRDDIFLIRERVIKLCSRINRWVSLRRKAAKERKVWPLCLGTIDAHALVIRGGWIVDVIILVGQAQPAQPPIRQLLGAADAQTAHPATFSTAPAHQLLGSANAETTPARAPAAAAVRTQRPDATCEGKNG